MDAIDARARLEGGELMQMAQNIKGVMQTVRHDRAA